MTALLRTAGLGIDTWLAAADTELADDLRRLAEAEDRYLDYGRVLADRIALLVPHLDPERRRLALDCRRRLHNGLPVDDRLAEAAGVPRVARLAEWIVHMRAELTEAVAKELDRLLVTPWALLTASPVGAAALRDGDIEGADDITRRLGEGESWHGKRLRRRSEYLWRMIARGAVKTTPRGWLGHVSAVRFGGDQVPLLTDDFTACWTENVHTALPADSYHLTPLHRVRDDRLEAWIPADGALRKVSLRWTPALRAACRGEGPPEFIARLASIGVLEPAKHIRTDRGFLDVYRTTSGPWPSIDVSAFHTVRRLHALIDLDDPRVLESPRPGPVLDAWAAMPPIEHTATTGWPAPRDGSGYAELRRRIAAGTHDITSALLDELGAPLSDAGPFDCLVRPLPNGTLVLEDIAPAATVDARFIDALTALHGPLPQFEEHRAQHRTSIELLIPPMTARAANAVRRPRYTDAWTGDPDIGKYCADTRGTYIPLSALHIRADGIIEADGTPVRIVYHSARSPLPPWDRLARVLCPPGPRARRLRGLGPRITVDGKVVVSPRSWLVPPLHGESVVDKAVDLMRQRDRLDLPRWLMTGTKPVPCDLDSLRAITLLDRGGVVEEMLPRPDELSVLDSAGTAHAAALLLRIPRAAGTGTDVRQGR